MFSSCVCVCECVFVPRAVSNVTAEIDQSGDKKHPFRPKGRTKYGGENNNNNGPIRLRAYTVILINWLNSFDLLPDVYVREVEILHQAIVNAG